MLLEQKEMETHGTETHKASHRLVRRGSLDEKSEFFSTGGVRAVLKKLEGNRESAARANAPKFYLVDAVEIGDSLDIPTIQTRPNQEGHEAISDENKTPQITIGHQQYHQIESSTMSRDFLTFHPAIHRTDEASGEFVSINSIQLNTSVDESRSWAAKMLPTFAPQFRCEELWARYEGIHAHNGPDDSDFLADDGQRSDLWGSQNISVSDFSAAGRRASTSSLATNSDGSIWASSGAGPAGGRCSPCGSWVSSAASSSGGSRAYHCNGGAVAEPWSDAFVAGPVAHGGAGWPPALRTVSAASAASVRRPPQVVTEADLLTAVTEPFGWGASR